MPRSRSTARSSNNNINVDSDAYRSPTLDYNYEYFTGPTSYPGSTSHQKKQKYQQQQQYHHHQQKRQQQQQHTPSTSPVSESFSLPTPPTPTSTPAPTPTSTPTQARSFDGSSSDYTPRGARASRAAKATIAPTNTNTSTTTANYNRTTTPTHHPSLSNHPIPPVPPHYTPTPNFPPTTTTLPNPTSPTKSFSSSSSNSSNSNNSSPPKRKHVSRASTRSTPTHIPRPRNSFILFRSYILSQKRLPFALPPQQNQASVDIAVMWNSADEETRMRFEEMARREKEEHARRYPDYRYAPRKVEEVVSGFGGVGVGAGGGGGGATGSAGSGSGIVRCPTTPTRSPAKSSSSRRSSGDGNTRERKRQYTKRAPIGVGVGIGVPPLSPNAEKDEEEEEEEKVVGYSALRSYKQLVEEGMMLPTPEQTPERKIRSPVIESPSLPVDGGIFHFNAESESEEDGPFNTLFQGKFDAMHNFGFDTTGTPEFSFMDDSEYLVAGSMNVPCLASSAYYAPTFEYGSRGRSVFGGGEILEMSGSPLAPESTPVSTPVVVDSSMAAKAATTTTTTDTNANANTNTSTSTNTNGNGNGSVSGGEMYSGAIKPTVPLWNAQADWNYWDDTFYGSGGDVVFDFGMDMDVSVDLGVGVDVLGTQLGNEFDGLRF